MIGTATAGRNAPCKSDSDIDGWGFANSAGDTWTPSGSDSLTLGTLYHWRIAHRASDGYHGWWQSSSFLVFAAA